MKHLTLSLISTLAFLFLGSFSFVQADPIPKKYRKVVRRGLQWLAKNQAQDGSWTARSGRYVVPMTALAGMALLMEGSTVRSGRYSRHIRRAADWLMLRVQKGGNRDGLIGNPNNPVERSRYMYGHGFGLLFLASVYGDEEDKERRERLRDILTRAVKYCVNAQSSRGGWYYTSAKDGHDRDEGSVTITQVQALRAARNAGIQVPPAAIKKAYEYLKACTSPNGAVYYSLRSRTERPAITAAAVACLFNAGQYKDPLGKRWLKYCRRTIPLVGGNGASVRFGHIEYTHYYFAQCVYVLGDDGWEDLFGKTPKNQQVTWTGYRQRLFDQLAREQSSNGSWTTRSGFSVGPVYSTALYCTILQLDKGTLPIYQR